MASLSDAEETTCLLSETVPKEPAIEHAQHHGNASASYRKSNQKEIYIQRISTVDLTVSVEIDNQSDDGQYILHNSFQDSVSKIPPHLRTSNIASLMNLIKGNIGTGILAMPSACNYAGLVLGPIGVLLIGFIATHCMHILLNCSRRLRARNHTLGPLGYAEILEQCLQMGPKRLQKFSKAGKICINVFLILTQFGFCCVYILFVAQNVRTVFESFHLFNMDVKLYLLIIAALLTPYCFVKNLKHLAPFSTFANILLIVGLVIIFQNIVQGLPDVTSRPYVTPLDKIPLYFGTAVFAFEAIGLVMPIENRMRHPEDLGGKLGILNLGMTFIVCLYAAMGFYGFLKFGKESKGSITLNLPSNNWLYTSVLFMYAVSVFISFGLQLYVVIKILWPKIESRISSRRTRWLGEYVFRTVLVFLSCGIAMVVPHLDLLISLVGSLASSSLALMIPPIIEVVTLAAEPEGIGKWIWLKNVLIFLFGVVGFFTGTYSALNEIITNF